MSTKVSIEEVKKVAHLSRISKNPSDIFLDKFAQELSKILTYFEELNEIDVSQVSSISGNKVITFDELRPDEPSKDVEKYSRIRQNIINNFPATQNNLLVVPGIFE